MNWVILWITTLSRRSIPVENSPSRASRLRWDLRSRLRPRALHDGRRRRRRRSGKRPTYLVGSAQATRTTVVGRTPRRPRHQHLHLGLRAAPAAASATAPPRSRRGPTRPSSPPSRPWAPPAASTSRAGGPGGRPHARSPRRSAARRAAPRRGPAPPRRRQAEPATTSSRKVVRRSTARRGSLRGPGRAIASTSPGSPAPVPMSQTDAPGGDRLRQQRRVEQVPVPQPRRLARPDQPAQTPSVASSSA